MEFRDMPAFVLPGQMIEFVVIDVPLCDAHPFMGQAQMMSIIGFLLLLPMIGLAALLDSYIHRYVFVFPIVPLVIAGVVLLVWSVFTTINSEGFTKNRKGVTVNGVSEEFVEAMDEEWTNEDFKEALRENRRGRKRQPPVWASPWVYVPGAIAAAYLLFSPIGFLVAMTETEGAWPARRPGQPVPPNNQPNDPTRDGTKDQNKDGPKDQPRDGVKDGAKDGPKDGSKDGGKPVEGPKPLQPETFPGLVAYWPLDENAGGGAVGKPGGLALVNGAKWAAGVKGSALEFNGKGDHVNLGPGARVNFNAGAAFTLACWAKTEADEAAIVSFRNNGKAQPVIAIQVRGGKVTGWVRDDGALRDAALVTGASIKDGKWHHVALVRHADGTVEVFLDAASQGKQKAPHSGGAITTDLRTLGGDRIPMGPKVKVKKFPDFAGSIDEFCVYNRALDEKDIAILAGLKK
jgi:hypothetical protein